MSKNFSLKLEGVEDIKRHLIKAAELKDVQNAVKLNTSEMQQKAQRQAPVDTGHLKRSIGVEIKNSGFEGRVDAGAEYAGYVNYGTRYMAARPFMTNAFREQEKQFRRDLERLMK